MSGKSAKRLRQRERDQTLAAQGGSRRRQVGVGQHQQQIQQVFAQFSGPLPLPDMLRAYDDVVPGSAERILTLAEKEAIHRHSNDRAFIRYRFSSMFVAGAIAIVALGGGIYLSATGRSTVGLAIIITEIIGLTTAFLVSQIRG